MGVGESASVAATAVLRGMRIVELATEIAGPYCGKLLVDAGAEVVKLEPPGGDPLRSWTSSHQDLQGADGVLFRHINASKRSIELHEPAAGSPDLDALLPGCHLVIENGQLTLGEIAELRARHPHVSVVSVSPCGKANPFGDRPSTEFTLQATCGSIAGRGDADRLPFYAAGRLGEWAAGSYAAVAAAALLFQSRRDGCGDHADVSTVAAMTMTMTSYRGVRKQLALASTYDNSRALDVPSIEPTKDGYVGFAFATRQQFDDLLVMIERPDLLGDDHLASAIGRRQRRTEFLAALHAWTTRHTSEEIVELASAFRVPMAVIGEPDTIPHFDHFVERGVFATGPEGDFVGPRPPFRIDAVDAPPATPAPRLGADAGGVTWPARAPTTGSRRGRPLEGIKVIDLTAFWAGPAASQTLALLGADVIKVESIQRPDGLRFTGCRPRDVDQWWEYGYFFQAVNTDKRGITLDLTSAEGRDALLRLVAEADVLMENFTPRVLGSFGLDPATLLAVNPSLVVTRMPGFGLDGTWRDRPGFAQTMEQLSGMAWLTGYPDGPPCCVPGLCDPVAGIHGAFATLAALVDREASGRGHLIESPMIEAALNVAPELVLERTAYGAMLERSGNRGPGAAPQGVYRAAGTAEALLAVAVPSDTEWRALLDVLELDLLRPPELDSEDGRRAAADTIDAALSEAIGGREAAAVVDELNARGVPAALVVSGEAAIDHQALRGSGFVEQVEHPVVGRFDNYVMPFRLAGVASPWIRRPAPTLGQHNREILEGALGLDKAAVDDLVACGVIGSRPLGA